MNKKRATEIEDTAELHSKPQLTVPVGTGSAFQEEIEVVAPSIKALSEQITTQLSKDKVEGDAAIGMVIKNVVGYLGDTPGMEGEMQQFLEMLVDSDPTLRAELLDILKG